MSDLNRVVLVGRLTRDPEMRSTNSGSYFCRFTLASNRFVAKKDSDTKQETGFFDCVAWGRSAETINKYVRKGQRIAIDGSLRFSEWANNEGKKNRKVEIFVENFQFLEARGQAQAESSAKSEPEFDEVGGWPSGSEPMSDEEIPF